LIIVIGDYIFGLIVSSCRFRSRILADHLSRRKMNTRVRQRFAQLHPWRIDCRRAREIQGELRVLATTEDFAGPPTNRPQDRKAVRIAVDY
jgi:hypothetical protein